MPATFTVKSALEALGVSETTLSGEEQRSLDAEGYLVLPAVLGEREIEAICARLDELLTIEGDRAGLDHHQEKGAARLGDLIDKGDEFRVCFTRPRVMAALAYILDSDIKLAHTSGISSRAALPGEGAQKLHADWAEPVQPGEYQVANSIWLLDDFTQENGATRLVPGSHTWGRMPSDIMPDPLEPHPGERLLVGKAGTVVVINGHLWHGGTVNRTDAPRRALHSYWTRRTNDLEPSERRHTLLPETLARLSPAEKFILGY